MDAVAETLRAIEAARAAGRNGLARALAEALVAELAKDDQLPAPVVKLVR